MTKFIAYIDEAGDDGLGKIANKKIGGQSQWFVAAACLVDEQEDRQLPGLRNDILGRFYSQRRDLHFRTLKHEEKVVACQTISLSELKICVVLCHKTHIASGPDTKPFFQKGTLYHALMPICSASFTWQPNMPLPQKSKSSSPTAKASTTHLFTPTFYNAAAMSVAFAQRNMRDGRGYNWLIASPAVSLPQ